MQLQLVVNMETATIEQLHRLQQQQLKTIDKLPALRRVRAPLPGGGGYSHFYFMRRLGPSILSGISSTPSYLKV